MHKRALLLAILVAGSCAAPAAEMADATKNAIKAALGKRLPDRVVESVQPSPMKDLYEVVLKPRTVVYTDAEAKYVLFGDLVDTDRRVSVTQERVAQLAHTDFKDLPFGNAIKIVKGAGTRQVAVFADPDCPFCRKLESETLSKVGNATINVFLYPLEIHTGAAEKAKAIWCAGDRAKAWDQWITQSTLPASTNADCKTPLEQNKALADRLDVNGTPTMVFQSGRIVVGAIDALAFEQYLNEPAR
jgi:thiol:disulfide interchange protein DsbC